MKTLRPVKQPPGSRKYIRHQGLYDQIDALKKGEWLPVECDNEKQAKNLRTTLFSRYAKHGIRLQTSVDGNVTYVRYSP